MKILVTGHEGYIGGVLVPVLQSHGHDVIGLDTGLLAGCELRPPEGRCESIVGDIRDVGVDDVRGFDAICHLAGLSNDPLGDLNPACTYDINHRAAVRLAEVARAAGVPRFLQASTCSVYGDAGAGLVAESAPFNPLTHYARSKALVERDVSRLADETFSPVFLRSATAYGVSPRLRGDLVVNHMVAHAWTTGRVLVKSDGAPWRPFVHVEDIARAFVAALQADRVLVHNRAFNVGRTEENYQVRDIASMVASGVPGSVIEYAAEPAPDARCYRVDSSHIREVLPDYRPTWTVRLGVDELRDAYRAAGLDRTTWESPRFLRIRHVRDLQRQGLLDASLRWTRARGLPTPATSSRPLPAAYRPSAVAASGRRR